uniref:Uncharacterized protein n=1 Tax=Chromera velia CCMP2878 TaxID=1169474 RepID=A0A0G4I308_9ALVE|eukprot:Cvel_10516.t1-p1 / transcript=Cvel_10516.t1 / gene=Cvel_10516 / organism=Chromera_velia_CCMP2878 / gene_product=hypothetical protein / transcript_product=hypothetical protein / location=Cvel_scaffold636:27526-32398(+) / protein_length=255 / sequence_SO=supercontig / SO=protein_coding / is_pseudo=false
MSKQQKAAEPVEEAPAKPEVAKDVTGISLDTKELPTGLQLVVTAQQILEDVWKHDGDIGKQHDAVASLLGLAVGAEDFRNQIEVDFHISNAVFCKEIFLTPMKCAVFVSIMADLLKTMTFESKISPVQGESYLMEETLDRFQSLMLKHSVGSGAGSAATSTSLGGGTEDKGKDTQTSTPFSFFAPRETKQLTEFAIETSEKEDLIVELEMPLAPCGHEVPLPDLSKAEIVTLDEVEVPNDAAKNEGEGETAEVSQ